MITRHVHRTVSFGFDEWADDEEIIYADSLVAGDNDEPDVDIESEDFDGEDPDEQ